MLLIYEGILTVPLIGIVPIAKITLMKLKTNGAGADL